MTGRNKKNERVFPTCNNRTNGQMEEVKRERHLARDIVPKTPTRFNSDKARGGGVFVRGGGGVLLQALADACVDEVEKLLASLLVAVERAKHSRCHGARPGLFHAAHHHAHVPERRGREWGGGEVRKLELGRWRGDERR